MKELSPVDWKNLNSLILFFSNASFKTQKYLKTMKIFYMINFALKSLFSVDDSNVQVLKMFLFRRKSVLNLNVKYVKVR